MVKHSKTTKKSMSSQRKTSKRYGRGASHSTTGGVSSPLIDAIEKNDFVKAKQIINDNQGIVKKGDLSKMNKIKNTAKEKFEKLNAKFEKWLVLPKVKKDKKYEEALVIQEETIRLRNLEDEISILLRLIK